jgi:uncharacterized caspase-like protein
MDTCQSGDLPITQLASIAAGSEASKGMEARAFVVNASATSAPGKQPGPRPWLHERRFINRDLASRTGAMVLSSSAGFESSWEDPAWRNGAFTEALLEALEGKGDVDEDGEVSVRELDALVRVRVPELTAGRQHPTLDRDNPDLRLTFVRTPGRGRPR